MRILQINASYKPAYIYGGPTMSVSKLAEELIKSGIQTEVYTTTANGSTELDVPPGGKVLIDGVPVTYFKRLTKDNSHLSLALLISLWNDLRKTEASGKVDYHNQTMKSCPSQIVHIHAWWNFVSVGSCLLALFASRPVVLSPRGTLSNYSFRNRKSFIKNIFHIVIGKRLLKSCHFHVTSEKEKIDVTNLFRPKTITIIPNFVELPSLAENYLEPKVNENKHLKLLFLSRIEEKKGLDILFNALKNFELPYHLTIAGTGRLNYILSLKSLASEFGVNDNITWIGQQNNDQKFNLLAAHDLMILPSRDESFANVVVESLSVGTAVLISSNVGLSDYVLEKDLGWVYDQSSDDLAEAIKTVIKQKEKRTLIRTTAPNQIALDFDKQHLFSRYILFYQNILDSCE